MGEWEKTSHKNGRGLGHARLYDKNIGNSAFPRYIYATTSVMAFSSSSLRTDSCSRGMMIA